MFDYFSIFTLFGEPFINSLLSETKKKKKRQLITNFFFFPFPLRMLCHSTINRNFTYSQSCYKWLFVFTNNYVNFDK